MRVIKEAKALEAAGCFSVVLECVPAVVAAAVTCELSIPTIGIGAGGGTSGQARGELCEPLAACACGATARPLCLMLCALCRMLCVPRRCWCITTCWA